MPQKKIRIEKDTRLPIGFCETQCLSQEPLFYIYRFGVRNITMYENYQNNFTFCYFIKGRNEGEKINLALIQNKRGNIFLIKYTIDKAMDDEMAFYIVYATVQRLSVIFGFAI